MLKLTNSYIHMEMKGNKATAKQHNDVHTYRLKHR